MSNGSSVGGFPGVSLGLPGGSNAGYSPTNNSYCIFSTSPRNESAAPTASIAGPPGGLPDAFSCVEGTTAGPNGFVVTYEGVSYACSSAPELPGSPLPGRKLLQSAAQSPALAALFNEQTANTVFENLLNAVNLVHHFLFSPWSCLKNTCMLFTVRQPACIIMCFITSMWIPYANSRSLVIWHSTVPLSTCNTCY